MIFSIGNQQYEYTNMPLQKFYLQLTIFLSDNKHFSTETFAVHDIKQPGAARNVIPCIVTRLGLRKPILSTQNTHIHIMVFVSLTVKAIQNLQISLKSLWNAAYMVIICCNTD